jgi:hypothetical protein
MAPRHAKILSFSRIACPREIEIGGDVFGGAIKTAANDRGATVAAKYGAGARLNQRE